MEDENNPLVSICCITYNQEKYIKDAIEGFLMQKTNFKFEIIIHDDASTDNTINIIKEYERKYPDIIKPIYESVNQYSLGKKASMICYSKAKGKYIALCEGDDYWIDENKLQKQIDYMEENEDCTFCFHNARVIYEKSKKEEIYLKDKSKYQKYMTKDRKYTAANIHLLGLGGIPTASFMFRTKFLSKLPDWFDKCVCGDMPIKLVMTGFGYAYYIDEIMSVYRREADGSMTEKWKKNEKNNNIKTIEHNKKLIKILEDYDEFTNHKYKKGLDISKKYYETIILILEENYKELGKKEYREYYKDLTSDNLCIKLFLKKNFNKLYKLYKNRGK